MSAGEKSDLPKVAEKRANKAASAVAELVERRGGAKENAELQSTVRTQSREAVSQAQARIREAVNRNMTALLHHLTIDVLRAMVSMLNENGSRMGRPRHAPPPRSGYFI
jgi:RNA-directed DNA polymerase